jgi:TIR domain
MSDQFFISYSSVDGIGFSLKLADELAAGPPPIPVWVDKRNLRPAEDWDEQIVEAIKTCKGRFLVAGCSAASN